MAKQLHRGDGPVGRARTLSVSIMNANPQLGAWQAAGTAIAQAPNLEEIRSVELGGTNISFNTQGHSARFAVQNHDGEWALATSTTNRPVFTNPVFTKASFTENATPEEVISPRRDPTTLEESHRLSRQRRQSLYERHKGGKKENWGRTIIHGFKAFWKFFKTPSGFLLTIYFLNIIAWGAMLFFLLLNAAPAMNHPSANDINSPRKKWLEIDSQILNALFCITGFGLAPWRFRDLFFFIRATFFKNQDSMKRLAEQNKSWFRPPPTYTDQNDLEMASTSKTDGAVHIVTFTGDQAPPTPLWKLGFVIWMMVLNTILQAILCYYMWAYNRINRPTWATGTFIALGCCVAMLAGTHQAGPSKNRRLRDLNGVISNDDDHLSNGRLPDSSDSRAPLRAQISGHDSHRNDSSMLSSDHSFVPSAETLFSESMRSQPETSEAPSIPLSFISLLDDTRALSLNSVLDPDKGLLAAAESSNTEIGTDSDGGMREGGDDPIHLRLLSQLSAQYLFEGFFKHFNPLVGLLDPQLYTFSYTREKSPLLLSTILAISARVFQPESYTAVQKHSDTLLAQVLLTCDAAIENIWAIVADYPQVNLARQQRDQERLWLALGNLDRSSSLFTGRPVAMEMINKEIGARGWLSVETWAYPQGDSKVVATFELTQMSCPVLDAIVDLREAQDPSSASRSFQSFRKAMEAFNVAVTEWGQYWSSKFLELPDSEPFQSHLILFFQDYTRLYFNSVLLHRLLLIEKSDISYSGAIEGTMQLCFSCALGVLQHMIKMGHLDILYFVWDTAHLMTGYSAMMVLKLVNQFRHQQLASTRNAFETLAEISDLYSIAARSLHTAEEASVLNATRKARSRNPAEVQARLLGAILARLKTNYKPATPDSNGSSLQASSGTVLTSMEGGYQGEIANAGVEDEGTPHNLFPVPMTGQAESSDLTPCQETDYVADGEFMNSMFTLAGLVSWDEPGIFIESR
ncbi:hypothetical protein FGADI_6510 [Fusarium gaditjirri]|uniref:Transcription factor domain-containing protein n=1 Tax=Fusarium gaditjirri TaxID=282569 RepID=A0A8H4WWB6_9HYPO|nr:hypothetical protein FGADI_6510 [Fusarium gaditjirri]